MSKIKVIYVVNNDTQNDFLEAPNIMTCLLPPKIGKVTLRELDGTTIKIIQYGQCEKIEYLEM